jgi:lipoprotein signal peptidase
MTERNYRLLFWVLAISGLAADQVSKYTIFSRLRDADRHSYVLFHATDDTGFKLVAEYDDPNHDGHVVPHVNQGALFGFLRQHKEYANLGFAIISLLAALAIIGWSMLASTARDGWLCAALGLILAGTLGNFYDRVTFNGVRDFLHWNYLFDWPVFNIADVCLVCGASLLLIQAFFGGQTAPVATPASAIQSATR